jgi:hypothetical protein
MSGKEGKQNTGTTLTFCCSSGGLGLCARVRARMGAGGDQSALTRSPEFEVSCVPPRLGPEKFTFRAFSGELNSSLAGPTAPLPSPRWYQWYQCAALSSSSGAGWCALGVDVRPRPEGLSSELRLGLNNPPVIGRCRRGALRGGKKSSTGGIFGDEGG